MEHSLRGKIIDRWNAEIRPLNYLHINTHSQTSWLEKRKKGRSSNQTMPMADSFFWNLLLLLAQ
jgi:hypothetical protein